MQHHSVSSTPVVRSSSWPGFGDALAGALAHLTDDQYLILQLKDRPWFVQFAVQGMHAIRAEFVANQYLQPSDLIPEIDLLRAAELGWQTPTGRPKESTPEADPDGSPNHFVDLSGPTSASRAATLAVDTLVEVMHVPHPQRLRYRSFTIDGDTILLPSLELSVIAPPRRRPAAPWHPADDNELIAAIDHVLRHSYGEQDVRRGDNGAWVFMLGEQPIDVRVGGRPSAVSVAAPIGFAHATLEAQLSMINDLNLDQLGVVWVGGPDGLAVRVDIPSDRFTPDELRNAIRVVRSRADRLIDDLFTSDDTEETDDDD